MSLLAIESKIQINFRSPDGYCCICNGVFRVLKTQKTTIISLKYGIKISDSGITHLSDNFLIYCRCIHELASARIKEVQDKRGGYILHIDATVEEDSDMVFVGMNTTLGTGHTLSAKLLEEIKL